MKPAVNWTRCAIEWDGTPQISKRLRCLIVFITLLMVSTASFAVPTVSGASWQFIATRIVDNAPHRVKKHVIPVDNWSLWGGMRFKIN